MAGRLRVLGSGTAFNAGGRISAGMLVEPAGAGAFLVDAGPGILPALGRSGASASAIERLFLTHLHGDHTAGWPFLLLRMALEERRREPLVVHGPAGTRERLESLARACYEDLLDEPGFEIDWREIPAGARTALEAGEIRAETEPVRHHRTSLGWRFDLPPRPGGFRLAVTGDTGACPGVELLAAGADLLLLECTSARPGIATHLSLDEVRVLAPRLGARRILLVHLDDQVARELARDPIPRVLAAHDGLELELAAAS